MTNPGNQFNQRLPQGKQPKKPDEKKQKGPKK